MQHLTYLHFYIPDCWYSYPPNTAMSYVAKLKNKQFNTIITVYNSSNKNLQQSSGKGSAEASKQRGQKTALGEHMASVEPARVGNGYPPPQPTTGSWSCKLLQEGSAQTPGEKRFYCFLSVSERFSLQRLLKINVVNNFSIGPCPRTSLAPDKGHKKN